METPAGRMQRLLEVTRRWREPSWPERQEAVTRALAASDFLTEEAAAFALNQQMHALTESALRRFVESLPHLPDAPCCSGRPTVRRWPAGRRPSCSG